MKRVFVFLMAISAVLFIASCDKTKSYTDMLKAERKAIDRLISENGFEILDDFPKDSVFAPHQFVEIDGVYLNIIYKGEGDTVAFGENRDVYARFKVKGLLGEDTTTVNTFLSAANYSTFRYNGMYSTFTQQNPEYFYVGEGVALPLKYVKEGARVKLIVPFKKGSTPDQTSGQPRYFMDLRYTFELK